LVKQIMKDTHAYTRTEEIGEWIEAADVPDNEFAMEECRSFWAVMRMEFRGSGTSGETACVNALFCKLYQI
jgi:hypothetical protein